MILCRLEINFVFYPKCREKHKKTGETSTSNCLVDSAICSLLALRLGGRGQLIDINGAARPKDKPQTVNFDAFKKSKGSEPKKNATEKRENVSINVDQMELKYGENKKVYGKTFAIKLPKGSGI